MRLEATLLVVALAAGCSEGSGPSDPGAIQVTTTTSGPSPDSDGYTVHLTGGAERPIDPNGSTEFAGLEGGNYEVTLGGMADNCAVSGANPRATVVTAGATARIGFQVACVTPSGSIEITTQTAGTEPDPDGYHISVDGQPSPSPIPVAGSVTISPVPVGTHSLHLEGVAPNCLVAGPSPVSITVTVAGAAQVQFQVDCPPPGRLHITSNTTGTPPDADGYLVRVDDGAPQPIDANGSVTLELGAWAHDVWLGDIAGNCAVNGTNPRAVTMAAGVTTEITFAVSCSGDGTGEILVRTHSSGTFTDLNGYTVTLDGSQGHHMGITDVVHFTEVAPGSHSVRLTGLAPGCGFFLQNPQQVTVAAGVTTTVDFNVICIP